MEHCKLKSHPLQVRKNALIKLRSTTFCDLILPQIQLKKHIVLQQNDLIGKETNPRRRLASESSSRLQPAKSSIRTLSFLLLQCLLSAMSNRLDGFHAAQIEPEDVVLITHG